MIIVEKRTSNSVGVRGVILYGHIYYILWPLESSEYPLCPIDVKLSEESIANRNLELGLVHCDVHIGNIIQKPSGDNILLDFDLCHFGPLAEDLGNTIFSLTQKSLPKAEAQDRVLQAYCEARQIQKLDERVISYFVKKKALVNQLWLSRRRFMPPRDDAS